MVSFKRGLPRAAGSLLPLVSTNGKREPIAKENQKHEKES